MDFWSKLVDVLPKIRTRFQLYGLIITVAAFVATRAAAPNAINAQIAAGAIGVLFIVFGQVFSSLRAFPAQDRSRVVLILFFMFCVFVIALIVTTGFLISRDKPTGGDASTQKQTQPGTNISLSLLRIGPITYGRSSMSFSGGVSTFQARDYGMVLELQIKNSGDQPGTLVSGEVSLGKGEPIAQGEVLIPDAERVIKAGDFRALRLDVRFRKEDQQLFPPVLTFSKDSPLPPVQASGGTLAFRIRHFDGSDEEQTIQLPPSDIPFSQ